jgi:hypothetical protein
MKNVRIIPPKPKENKKLRVAAYCRVSTSGPEQLRSLEVQISAYKKMIKSRPDWIFAGVYYDIESGLRLSGRKSLDKLLRRAEKGKVLWRCATRIEKGKDACPHSPTLDEGWVQDTLGSAVCQDGVYDENTIRNEVNKIQVLGAYILILRKDGSPDKRLFRND